jgi:hypothetical protein
MRYMLAPQRSHGMLSFALLAGAAAEVESPV